MRSSFDSFAFPIRMLSLQNCRVLDVRHHIRTLHSISQYRRRSNVCVVQFWSNTTHPMNEK